jgi:hypothetical protein
MVHVNILMRTASGIGKVPTFRGTTCYALETIITYKTKCEAMGIRNSVMCT